MMSGQVWGTVQSIGGQVLEGKQNNSKQICFFRIGWSSLRLHII